MYEFVIGKFGRALRLSEGAQFKVLCDFEEYCIHMYRRPIEEDYWDCLAINSTGEKYVNGQRNDEYNTSWMSVENNELIIEWTVGDIDELYIEPKTVNEQEALARFKLGAPLHDPSSVIDARARPIYMHQSDIKGHGHTVYDQHGNKAVFSGVDPETNDRGYKIYDYDGSEAAFLGVRTDGERQLMLYDGDRVWLDPSGVTGTKVKFLPWQSLDVGTQLLFANIFSENFIILNEDGTYGFNFGNGQGEIKSYVIKASADAYVDSLEYIAFDVVYGHRDINYGSATRLRLAIDAEYYTGTGARTNYDQRAYIKFAGVSSIPPSEEIIDVELRIYFTERNHSIFHVSATASTWSESTITSRNQPGFTSPSSYFGVTGDGLYVLKSSGFLNFIRQTRDQLATRGIALCPGHPNKKESIIYSREGSSTYCPTLVLYTRETQNPIDSRDLHIPGGIVFLNRKIFDVEGKTLTLTADRSDITIYVYENENGGAVIDFAHGGRVFKTDSYVILGTAQTNSTKITGTSTARSTGRKEGPPGMGNDIFSFGFPGDGKPAIDFSTLIRTPQISHNLGGNKHEIKLEIKPAGTIGWHPFLPVAYDDGGSSKGATMKVANNALLLYGGTDFVYSYIDSQGSFTDVTSAQLRGIITRLD